MKTKIKFSAFILFLGIILNNQDVLSFDVSLVSSIDVPLECSDYSHQENATFTGMAEGDSWQFDLVIGDGNLTLYDPHIVPMWSFVHEGSGIYMNYGSSGTVKIIFGISEMI